MKKRSIRYAIVFVTIAALTTPISGCGKKVSEIGVHQEADYSVAAAACTEAEESCALPADNSLSLRNAPAAETAAEVEVKEEMKSAADVPGDDLLDTKEESVPTVQAEAFESDQTVSGGADEEHAEPETAIKATTLDFPSDMPSTFIFSSGAGGWSTQIEVQKDGTFTGSYYDSEMGTAEAEYPNGTVFYCSFSGKLDVVEQLNEYAYALKLAKLDKEKGEEYIGDDGIRYVPSEPYGMEKGKNYILYLPETSLEDVSSEFLMWWPGRYETNADEHTSLGCYGLYNKETKYGFFGYVE